jgi:radical SAM protein with 4Fe4S-binding SPASM domain
MIKEKIKSINKRYYPKKIFFAPEWIVLGVNNICNLHCKMCDVGIEFKDSNFYQNLMGSSPMNMPLELIQKVFDQTSKYFPNAKIGYAFTEPLIYPYLVESLKYANDKNLYTAITTNALNLKTIANDLINVNLNELFVSLDGPAEIHNQIRGHKSSFERAVAGIENLIESENRPKISVYCVVTEWNIGHLKRFADYFEKYPLTQLGFMHTNYTPPHIADIHNKYYYENYPATASNMEKIDLNNFDLQLLLTETKEIKNKTYPYPVTFSPEINTKDELEMFYHKPEVLIGKSCSDANRTMMIKSDGTVIPAHGRCYQLTIGNIYNQSLKEIWNSKIISKFRSDLNKAGGLLPACSRCCSAF